MRGLAYLTALACLGATAGAVQNPDQESAYYSVDYLTPPGQARVEVGGMDFLSDGRLVVSTRRGQVWMVHDPMAEDPEDVRFQLFAEGLHEGLGLEVVDDVIYVVQRTELSRLVDADRDGRCDRIETVTDDWGVSGNYHEFAFGLPRDLMGNFYIGLNVSFFSPQWWHGKSPVPYRGWILKVAPDGTTTPIAKGVRSPCGLGVNAEGDIFYTDNQGDWMPVCPIYHVKEGAFFGHPAGLDWTADYQASGLLASDTEPPKVARNDAAVWLPYDWSRSAGNLVHDDTQGGFGPFQDQLFVAELTNGQVLRVALEKVRGEYQGAVFMFRRGVGSAVRVRFAPDGSLFAGMTNRGWGGLSPESGLARIRWTGKTPMEMETAKIRRGGFDIDFTLPLAEGLSLTPGNVDLTQYDYNWWWDYGSPEQRTRPVEVQALRVSEDRRRLSIDASGLEAGMMARMVLSGVMAEGGIPLLHDEMNYTINQFPSGPRTTKQIAVEVPRPEPRETWDEGWIQLAEGDVLDVWSGRGWTVDPSKDADLPVLAAEEEWTTDLLAELPKVLRADDLMSRFDFGDMKLHAEVRLPEFGTSGILLMGRYAIQLFGEKEGELSARSFGGVAQGTDWLGQPPDFHVYRGPERWHNLDIIFQAPRFDGEGRKISSAILQRVLVDDTLCHEQLFLPGPTEGALWTDEAARGPLVLQGSLGPVEFRNVRVKPMESADVEGWETIFDGETLEGWRVSDGGTWRVEKGAIVGEGPTSHLFSPRNDYKNFEFQARVKIGHDSNSGMYVRAAYGSGWPAGYEAQVNADYSDPVRTGSLYGHDLILARLVDAETWFDQRVRCVDEAEGTHITIWVNGAVVADFIDAERQYAVGHVALQQHHDGSRVYYKDLQVRELP
ncbi:MAG: family 16 glycoside hydrolase [Planctomycetota bacterium]|nr:family 16 glycoside hydrolase [Planctomycetota bacterium]